MPVHQFTFMQSTRSAFKRVEATPRAFFFKPLADRQARIKQLCEKHQANPARLVDILLRRLTKDFQLYDRNILVMLQDDILAAHQALVRCRTLTGGQRNILLYKLLLLETQLATYACENNDSCPLGDKLSLNGVSQEYSIEDKLAYCFVPFARAMYLNYLANLDQVVQDQLSLILERLENLLRENGVLLLDIFDQGFTEKYQDYLTSLDGFGLKWPMLFLDSVDPAVMKGMIIEYAGLNIDDGAEEELFSSHEEDEESEEDDGVSLRKRLRLAGG